MNQLTEELPRQGVKRERPAMPAGTFEVRSVPLPVPGSKREVWKLSILVLVLNHCRASSATLEQLNVLAWAVRDGANAAEFKAAWNAGTNFQVLRAWDETLLRTIRLGISIGIFEWLTSSRIKLTEQGSDLAKTIYSDRNAFAEEKHFLSAFQKLSTSAMWSRLGEVVPAQLSRLKEK